MDPAEAARQAALAVAEAEGPAKGTLPMCVSPPHVSPCRLSFSLFRRYGDVHCALFCVYVCATVVAVTWQPRVVCGFFFFGRRRVGHSFVSMFSCRDPLLLL